MMIDYLHYTRIFYPCDCLRLQIMVDQDDIFARNVIYHGRRVNVEIFQDKIGFLIHFARNSRLTLIIELFFEVGIGNRTANGIGIGASVTDNVGCLVDFFDFLDKCRANIINRNFTLADGQSCESQYHSDDKSPHSQEKFQCPHEFSPPFNLFSNASIA